MTTEYLIELIKNNTRVILPEFGAFLIKDDGSGVFKPENLTFSPFLKYNDGMLEDILASKKKTTKDKARALLSSYIESLKQELTEKSAFELKDIGILYLDNRGSIHYSPIGSEAKKTVQSPKEEVKKEEPIKKEIQKDNKTAPKQEIQEEKKEKLEKPNIEKKTDEVAAKEPTKAESKTEPMTEIKSTPVIPVPQKTENKTVQPIKKIEPKPLEQKRSSGTGKAILIGTLIGLGLVVLLAGGWYMYNTGLFTPKKTANYQQTTLAQKESSMLDKTTGNSADKTNESEVKIEEEAQQTGKFDDEFNKLSVQMEKTTPDEPDKKPAKTRISQAATPQSDKVAASYVKEGIFHLVVGSFRNVSYAEKYSDDMKTSGYKSRVITQPTGMHAVTLGSFLTRQEAEDSMNVWKAQHPSIWILNQ
ncbi:MAG: SPOR domain-containing protein [Bacteroidales bacterium]|jgi:nucleoid DNA-binding protein|nr:SPOR domain-containing protein [Bacteroidales bacterium]MDD4384466.1 SPOR domain-containing protein [Bacteroidales bacterium]MDY0196819.1 SPOR domain-containing protein [Tenuifilaceae bacterium]